MVPNYLGQRVRTLSILLRRHKKHFAIIRTMLGGLGNVMSFTAGSGSQTYFWHVFGSQTGAER